MDAQSYALAAIRDAPILFGAGGTAASALNFCINHRIRPQDHPRVQAAYARYIRRVIALLERVAASRWGRAEGFIHIREEIMNMCSYHAKPNQSYPTLVSNTSVPEDERRVYEYTFEIPDIFAERDAPDNTLQITLHELMNGNRISNTIRYIFTAPHGTSLELGRAICDTNRENMIRDYFPDGSKLTVKMLPSKQIAGKWVRHVQIICGFGTDANAFGPYNGNVPLRYRNFHCEEVALPDGITTFKHRVLTTDFKFVVDKGQVYMVKCAVQC